MFGEIFEILELSKHYYLKGKSNNKTKASRCVKKAYYTLGYREPLEAVIKNLSYFVSQNLSFEPCGFGRAYKEVFSCLSDNHKNVDTAYSTYLPFVKCWVLKDAEGKLRARALVNTETLEGPGTFYGELHYVLKTVMLEGGYKKSIKWLGEPDLIEEKTQYEKVRFGNFSLHSKLFFKKIFNKK